MNQNAVIVLIGLGLLALFFWYFAVEDERRKRKVGTILSLVVTLLSLWAFVAPPDNRLIETLTNGNQRGAAGRLFGNIKLGIDLQGGSSFIVRIDPARSEDGSVRPVTKDVQQTAQAILEKRLNAYGTVDMAIIPQGEDRLEVQMPGVQKDEFARVREVIQKVAKLEFRLVHPNSATILAQKKPGEPLIEPGYAEMTMLRDNAPESETAARKAAGLIEHHGKISDFKSRTDMKVAGTPVVIPEEAKIEGGTAADLANDRAIQIHGRFKDDAFVATHVNFLGSIVVKNSTAVSGKDVVRAGVMFEPTGYAVHLSLNDRGADAMEAATTPNRGQQLAIVLDGEVISAPVIQAILRDHIQITGSFTDAQARDLASSLNNPLENPLVIESESSVTNVYGQDTIKQGVLSGVAGLAGILIFMLIYYRMAGLVAIVGLVVNSVILFGFMAVSQSTLTMLGIAGVILTVGMGVDANVLIYERLREELNQGKTLWGALQAGYDRAFSAIFDGHMTSLITAVILFWLGGGTIKGFAVSLTIGVIASLFGSLLVTRTLFNYFPNIQKLSFLDLIKNRHFDFMGKAKYWVGLSVIAIVGASILIGVKGGDALGVDLRGGDQIIIQGSAGISADAAEKWAHAVDRSAVVQAKTTLQGGSFLEVRTTPEMGQAVLESIEKGTGVTFPEDSRDIKKIGAQVGSEMLATSGWALLAGLVGILAYLTLRFEFAFSVGAIAALFHDLMFCVGALLITGRDINLLQVGALLTIAGYSTTDTVVIFDRIREYFHTHKGNLKDIMNDAISSTLSRTLLTSVCTLITVIFLYFFGGPALSDFSFTIIVGILIGTYSSIFVASPIVLWWVNKRNVDLRQDVIDAATARSLAEQGIEREVSPRKL